VPAVRWTQSVFAALGRIYGSQARSAITGISLLAGFASTVGGPLTAWGVSELGWRETCLGWAALHIIVGLPLNLLLPQSSPVATTHDTAKPHISPDWPMIVLGLAFAASWAAAMAVHLPRLLETAGASAIQAVAAGARIGPSQVGARVLEASFMKRFHPMVSARLSVALHPIGAAVLGFFGAAVASVPFTILHGAGSGILTIARGTVPLAIFGAGNYGYRLGLLGVPTRIATAWITIWCEMKCEKDRLRQCFCPHQSLDRQIPRCARQRMTPRASIGGTMNFSIPTHEALWIHQLKN